MTIATLESIGNELCKVIGAGVEVTPAYLTVSMNTEQIDATVIVREHAEGKYEIMGDFGSLLQFAMPADRLAHDYFTEKTNMTLITKKIANALGEASKMKWVLECRRDVRNISEPSRITTARSMAEAANNHLYVGNKNVYSQPGYSVTFNGTVEHDRVSIYISCDHETAIKIAEVLRNVEA